MLRVVDVNLQGFAVVCEKKTSVKHPRHNSNRFHRLLKECFYGRVAVAISWSSFLSVPSKLSNDDSQSPAFRYSSTFLG